MHCGIVCIIHIWYNNYHYIFGQRNKTATPPCGALSGCDQTQPLYILYSYHGPAQAEMRIYSKSNKTQGTYQFLKTYL